MSLATQYPVSGAGLGLRRPLMADLTANAPGRVDFFEIAPENWIGVGGRLGRQLRSFTERYPFVCHGLSLSLGGPEPLDEKLLLDIRDFMRAHAVRCYSEHLSYCSDDGHLYDLMPLPFTDEAVRHVSRRIRRVSEIIGEPMAIENVSYYAAPAPGMSEIDFLNAVLEEADCRLMLDINNIFVNSINHRYDPSEFLARIPAQRLVYFHVAGHYVEAEDLRVDTHGTAVCHDVWELLAEAYHRFGPVPTLLERDFNFPPVDELLGEVARVRGLQRSAQSRRRSAA
ncbi:MAG: DUF692 domain-containing protein [Steroidobacteraceae bacterium]